MVDIELFVKGIVVGFIASIPLGPVGVLVIQRTINKGKWHGFISGMGAATVDCMYALIAVLGLSYIINFIAEQHNYFQFVGGAILVFLGIRIFFTNPVKQLRRQMKRKNRMFEDFLSVIILTLSNPLAIFLFIAAFAGINMVVKKGNTIDSGLAIFGVFLGAGAWWLILSSLIALFRKKFRLKQLWWVNKIAGTVIFVFGIVAVTLIIVRVAT